MAKTIPLTDVRFAAAATAAGAAPVPAVAPTGILADTRGRLLRDLRISVTDRCNFRCVYCMPKGVFGKDYPFLPHAELLTFEEIARLVRGFKLHGVDKIRLTGGEPTVRAHIVDIVQGIAATPGISSLSMRWI